MKKLIIIVVSVFLMSCQQPLNNQANTKVAISNSGIIHNKVSLKSLNLVSTKSTQSNVLNYNYFTNSNTLLLSQIKANFYSDANCRERNLTEDVTINVKPQLVNGTYPIPLFAICSNYSNSQGQGCQELYNDTTSGLVKSMQIVFGVADGNSFYGECLHNSKLGYETIANIDDSGNPTSACSLDNMAACSLTKQYNSLYIYSPRVSLNTTGQTLSAPIAATLGFDGDVQAGIGLSNRFQIEKTNSGNCVIDNLTGLEWPQNWSVAKNTLWNQINLSDFNDCGYTDWRLPSQNDIASLFNYLQPDNVAWLKSVGFINIPFDNSFSEHGLWTSEAYLPDSSLAWITSLSHSGNYIVSKSTSYNYVLPVRNYSLKITNPVIATNPAVTGYGKKWPTNRFEVITQNNITCLKDTMTGLAWIQDMTNNGFESYMSLADANTKLQQLNSENFCGQSTWRMPSIYELVQLTNYSSTYNWPVAAWLQSQGFIFGTNINDLSPELSGKEFVFANTQSIMGNNFSYSLNDGYFTPAISSGSPMRLIPVSGNNNGFNPDANRFMQENIGGQICEIDTVTGLEWPKDWHAFANTVINMNTAREKFMLQQNQSYCGHKDWHIPTINELNSINNYAANSIAWLQNVGFINVDQKRYWSSTIFRNEPNTYWYEDFSFPEIKYTSGSDTEGFIMTREYSPEKSGRLASTSAAPNDNSGATWPITRFVATTDNGCQNDMLTGLMWVTNPTILSQFSSKISWQNAINIINDLNNNGGICGYHDWRLPNINELRSMVNYGVPFSADWLNINGFSGIQRDFYWSSSTTPWDGNGAYFLSYNDGYFWIGNKAKDAAYVWPVRGGISTKQNENPTPLSCKLSPTNGVWPLPQGDWQAAGLVAHYYDRWSDGPRRYFCENISYDGTTLKADCPKYEQREMGQFVDRYEPVEIKVSPCGSCTFNISNYSDNDNLICNG